MKHIEKKYLFQEKVLRLKKISNSNSTEFPLKQVDRRDKKTLKINKNERVFVKTTEGFFLSGFIYNYHGNYTVVPIPDLTLVYYDHSYQMNRMRKKKENELFEKLNSEDDISEDASNELYHYYGFASNCIISLFTSIESFINHLIPDEKTFQKVLKNKTEIYTKSQIQESLNFNEKVKIVIPYFFDGKNFFKKANPTNELINNLKQLRDDIIHTKSESNFELQELLLRRVLNFKYDKTLEAVAKFMNFYKNDYVQECNCGNDY